MVKEEGTDAFLLNTELAAGDCKTFVLHSSKQVLNDCVVIQEIFFFLNISQILCLGIFTR